MLVLNEKDILQAITMNDMVGAIEKAYVLYEDMEFQMPIRSQISDNENTLLLMPCIANHSMGTKIVSVFPDNREQPVTQGVVVLNDRDNGDIKAILNGTLLTGLKTGAVGGAAIKYLAMENVNTVGLIGAGFQGLYQLIAACAVRNIEHIHLYNRTSSKLPAFIDQLKKQLSTKVEIHVMESAYEVVGHSEIVITSTTSNTPVLPNVDMYNGKLVVGIGSYQEHMREFPEKLYMNLENLYIDTLDAISETGDIIDPIKNKWIKESQVISFSKVVKKKVQPVLADDCPTVFKSTGMALFDLVVAETIFEKAVQQDIGQYIDL